MILKIHRGFTIIELILVIAVIGILSIVIIPKYINLTTASQINSTRYIAAALSSANAENYAIRIANSANGIAIKNCNSAINLLQGGLPTGYKITSKSVKVDITVNCTLKGPSSTTATFLATGIH